jgi:hypothetical protein
MTTQQQDLPRVFFDPNEGPDSIRYALWLPQSLTDLDRIEPADGMRVVIYAADCSEMEATLEFDRCCDGWTARPVAPPISGSLFQSGKPLDRPAERR